MRAALLSLALLLGAAPGAGAAFSPPSPAPAVGGEVPVALAFGEGGRGVLVTQTSSSPYPPVTLATIRFPGGPHRTTYGSTELLDSVQRENGGVDLLVRHGRELVLRRVQPGGQVYDLWSARADGPGAVARSQGATIVAWIAGSTLKLVIRPDHGIPTHPRTARLGLRNAGFLDLAVDRAGRPVVAVSSWTGRLVLATVTTRGRVVRRQVRTGAPGLVSTATTPGGRVGVLVEDTGMEGEFGECVSDGKGRHLRAVTRGRGATAFGALQKIESPRFGCGSSGALLLGRPDESLVALYQGGSYDFPPLLARMAVAPSGKRFGAPATLASDARADTATIARGRLLAGVLRKTTTNEVFTGALDVLEPGGTPKRLSDAAFAPLLGTDGTGAAVMAWRTDDRLLVSVDR